MKIDLNSLNESAWAQYRPGVRLKVRPLSSSKREEFEKLATSNRIEFVNGRRQTVKEPDQEKMEELIRDWIVEDWEGLVDQDDNAIPCTKEMKVLILDYHHNMRMFALDTAMDLEDLKEKQQAEDSKN